jgi:hypothetical protein
VKVHGAGKVPAKFYNRYNRPDVLGTLESMYRGLCCYCESRIGDVAFGHIEHRRPKRRYPGSCFDWDNLHLACPKCNIAKGDKYDPRAEILDAVKDVPISKHMTYRLQWREPISSRGKTTVEHADLNRPELLEARMRVLLAALRLIEKLNLEPNDPAAARVRKELESYASEEHGSLIQHAIFAFFRESGGEAE